MLWVFYPDRTSSSPPAFLFEDKRTELRVMESDVETVEKTSRLCILMNMAKKFVITGTLLSSAPVLLPPFLVISTLGLAVSVPFGVMYASYACTDRIMSRLLPPTQMTQQEEEGSVSAIDDGKKEEEHGQEEEEEEVIVPIDQAQNLPVQSDDGGKKELGELLEMKSEKVVEIKGVDKEKKRLNVVKGIVRRRKKRKEGEGDKKNEKEKELHKQTEISVPEKPLQEESSRVSNEKEPAAPSVETRTESRVSKDEENQTTVDIITETNLKTKEVDDRKIWDKIDAIRAIIGFQSPRRTSYFEELQALYLCAGIEPPPSAAAGMEASADHADFEKKLRFLMSVIGLK